MMKCVTIQFFTGDGSERCLVCGWRSLTPSYYVGRRGRKTDEGYPERFPVCSLKHGAQWISYVERRSDVVES